MLHLVRTHRSLLTGLALLLSLVLFRMAWHQSLRFLFIPWNLFLAALPLLFAYYAARARRVAPRLVFAMLWLLFFPNSAYLITDLVHLRSGKDLAFWLDLVLLFGAGLYGVVLGLCSLKTMESRFASGFPTLPRALTIVFVLLLTGYGIYLGRVERWNSWDLLFRADDLLLSVYHDVRHPFRSRETWYLSAVFAAALGLAYFTFGRAESNDRPPI